MIFETERLFLRELRQTDFRDLAEILQNPKVMYAYEHDFLQTAEETANPDSDPEQATNRNLWR